MKKSLCFIAALVFILSIGIAACAETDSLPTIDEVLQNISSAQKTEVSDDMGEYSITNGGFEDFEFDFRFVFLQREAPEKEFTAKKIYPPFSDSDGFEDDFTGIDKSPARIWVRADIMNQLPSELCAKSLDEATYIIMAETIYELDGSLSVSDFKDSGDEELPEFENADEMMQYLLSHPKEVESITYYPKFGVYSVISIYEKESKKWAPYNYTYTSSKRFAKNPEAFLHWNNMTYISDLLDALDEEKGINTEYANKLMEAFDYVPQAKKDLWKACIDAEEYSTAYHSVSEYYWTMAEELKNLDPSEENRNNYDMIIKERNIIALKLFADYCEYAGFERSIDSIEAAKEYMANPDTDWTESILQELVSVLSAN